MNTYVECTCSITDFCYLLTKKSYILQLYFKNITQVHRSTCIFFSVHSVSHVNGSLLTPTGHSHQLFHICGIIGTHFQMKALETDMVLRQSQLLVTAPPITFNNTFGAALVCVCISLGIICLHILPLLYSHPDTHPTKNEGKKCKH